MRLFDYFTLFVSLLGWFFAGMYSYRVKVLKRANRFLRERNVRYKQILNTQYRGVEVSKETDEFLTPYYGDDKEGLLDDTRCPSRFEELRCQDTRGHGGGLHADVRGLNGPIEEQLYVQWNERGERTR